jgi:hypothetical protein
MKRSKTDLIVIHCSATGPDEDIGRDEIDDMHVARGWSGIGYQYVVRRNGLIEFGRGGDQVGAHAKGVNKRSVAVCLVGGVDKHGRPANNFTPEQWRSADLLVAILRHAYGDAEILGHRDLSPDLDGDGIIEEHEWMKACPCFDAKARWGS